MSRKNEDKSLIPRIHKINPGVVGHVCKTSSGEPRTGGALGLAVRANQLGEL